MMDDSNGVDAHDHSPLKRSASVGAGIVAMRGFLNSGSPSGSDLSDSSLPFLISGPIAPIHQNPDSNSSKTQI